MSKITTVVACIVGFCGGSYFGLTTNQNSLVEYLSDGTLRGLNACVSSNTSQLLTEADAREICGSRHSVNTTRIVNLEGLGNASQSQLGRYVFEGAIINQHPTHIVTFVEIELRVFDDEGAVATHQAKGNVWAPPFDEIEVALPFSRPLTKELLELEWCDHETPEDDLKTCKTWNVSQTAGIEI